MRHRRFSLTLLEVLIALSFAAIVLSALMTSYYQMAKKRIAAQELRKNCLSVELLRQRLIHLVGQVTAAEHLSFETGAHAQAVGPCLLFSCDNGVDPNPKLCGDVRGMLYQNALHQLCLGIWGKEKEMRTEVFLENVSDVSFSFFNPKKKTWEPAWKKEDAFPPFFELSWVFSDEPKQLQQCAFFFSREGPIVYETDGAMP